MTGGLLPSQEIRRLVATGAVAAAEPVGEDQVQPASLDLRLGDVAYRIRASFLPGAGFTVEKKVEDFAMHRIDLDGGAVLEKGCVYLVPLLERLALPPDLAAVANPKSSTGRLDIFTRLITDHATEFERVRQGYAGPLYAEISPRTFSILVRRGYRLNQLRFLRGAVAAGAAAGIPVTIDLRAGAGGLIGYRAKKHAGLIDVGRVAYYDPHEFWDPIPAGNQARIILNPDDFYILASKEGIAVPPDQAAEMIPYDTLVGEFRVHYAGFFDPGFGHGDNGGTRAVLEVRSHDVPFVVEDGQIVGRLIYESLTAVPDKLYGSGIGSSYQRQGLALSKQFKAPAR